MRRTPTFLILLLIFVGDALAQFPPVNPPYTTPTTVVVSKYFGSGAPGIVQGSFPGDLYYDTTGHVTYVCSVPFPAKAPACNSVGIGQWLSISSGLISYTATQVHVGSVQISSNPANLFQSDIQSTTTSATAGQFHSEFTGTINSNGVFIGLGVIADTATTSTGNLTNANGALMAVRGTVIVNGSGSITDEIAFRAFTQLEGGLGGSATNMHAFYAAGPEIAVGNAATNYYGFFLNPNNLQFGSLTGKFYGVYIPTMNGGAGGASKMAIYIQTDPSYFGGDLQVAGSLNMSGSSFQLSGKTCTLSGTAITCN